MRVRTLLSSALFLILATVHVAAVPAQNEEIALTALRSRAALIRAMTFASQAMGARGEGTLSGDRWQSAMLTSHKTVTTRNNDIIDLGVSATVTVTLRGELPDSVRASFRSQVTTTFPISSGERAGLARALLTEMALRTNRFLATDHTN
jgi:hypothetical protein